MRNSLKPTINYLTDEEINTIVKKVIIYDSNPGVLRRGSFAGVAFFRQTWTNHTSLTFEPFKHYTATNRQISVQILISSRAPHSHDTIFEFWHHDAVVLWCGNQWPVSGFLRRQTLIWCFRATESVHMAEMVRDEQQHLQCCVSQILGQ